MFFVSLCAVCTRAHQSTSIECKQEKKFSLYIANKLLIGCARLCPDDIGDKSVNMMLMMIMERWRHDATEMHTKRLCNFVANATPITNHYK